MVEMDKIPCSDPLYKQDTIVFFWHQAWQNFTTKKTLIWNIKNKK